MFGISHGRILLGHDVKMMVMMILMMMKNEKTTFESMGKTLCSRTSLRLLPSRVETSNVF